MKEELISFVWKFQYFNKNQLVTTNSEKLEIINVGYENKHTGPDFFNAQLIIDDQKWAGTIEIHVNASDWYVHGHEKDENYDNVILHVVWQNDVSIYRKDNSIIPTLELKNSVDVSLLRNYKNLFSNKMKWINCEDSIATVNSFIKESWMERLYIERLEQKAHTVLELVKQSNNDWEVVLYKLLLKNFGLKINAEVFFKLADLIDYSIIRKEQPSLMRLESLMFGSARLLEATIEDAYFEKLKKEYKYLAAKYNLQKTPMSVEFFRLRPTNFPTIRLAQFASLYHKHLNLFSKLMCSNDLSSFYSLLMVSASDYWTTHYSFEANSKISQKKLSKSFIDLLLINTIIPLKFVYQHHIGEPDNESIIGMMRAIKSEKNSVITKFSTLKINSSSAFSSQALLQLKNNYCEKKQCLKCAIGNQILSSI